MSAEFQIRDFRKHRVAGTAEGFSALLCVAYVFVAIEIPASRLPWDIILVMAFGVGLGIGGWRFGSRSGRAAGALAVLLLGLAFLVAVLLLGVEEWDAVWSYWSRLL
jgi:hypothetical protein